MTDQEDETSDSEPTAAPSTGPTAPPAPRARFAGGTSGVIAVVLAAVFGVTTVLLALIAVSLKSDRDELESTRRDVEAAAGRFVQALVDFRSGDMTTLRDDVVPLSADPFTGQFEEGVPRIEALNQTLGRVSSQATIKDVFVASVDGQQATAIVVYDAVETYASTDPIPLQNIYVRIGLVRLEGEWKVNDVINLNFALSPPPAADTTTTTAPSG